MLSFVLDLPQQSVCTVESAGIAMLPKDTACEQEQESRTVAAIFRNSSLREELPVHQGFGRVGRPKKEA